MTGDAAFGGEAERDLLADAAGGTGDDGNSSFETGHVTILVMRRDLLREVVEHDFAEAQRQVGDEVAGRHDLAHRQAR